MKTFFQLLIITAVILGLALVGLIYFSLPDVEYLAKSNPKTTAFIEMRKQQATEAGKRLRIRQNWVRFANIPELMKKTVRITEDASFYKHEGVDFEELKISLSRNFNEGKMARGGSTITQQLAKNLYLSADKTFIRKIKEYFIARRLEKHLSKNRIFHLYLNVIEFGRGVFGVEAAARYYFKCHVWELTQEQMIRLTAVIPRPLTIKPTQNKRWLLWKSNWILGKLKQYKYITSEEYETLLPAFK